jgi:hypothetical protein
VVLGDDRQVDVLGGAVARAAQRVAAALEGTAWTRRGRLAVRLGAPEAGTLTVRARTGRTVLLGARHRYTRAGSATLRAPLTPAGRRALRRGRGRGVTATVTLTFTPAKGAKVSVSERARLR